MNKILIVLVIVICIIQTPLIVSAENDNIQTNKIEYNDTTIVIDLPVSLDAYIICYDKSDNELWHKKLYSYEYINGISMEAQKVTILSLEVIDNKIKVIDSRNVIYYIDPENGTIIETNSDNYTIPDFSNVSDTTSPNNKGGMMKYLAIFGAFIGVGLIVYIASRNKK